MKRTLLKIFATLLGFLPAALGWMLGRVLFGLEIGRERPVLHIPRLDSAIYHGPALLEVFGHGEHLGWIHQAAEKIRMLQVDGHTREFDTRSRFRLTPLSFRELTSRASQYRDRRHDAAEYNAKRATAMLTQGEERRLALRTAVAEALEAFAPDGQRCADQANKAIQILEAARAKDDEYDDIPF